MNRSRLFARLLCGLMAVGAAPAFAGPPDIAPAHRPQTARTPPPPQWEQLTPAQRDMIVAVLRDRWNDNPHERTRMLEHAQRWKAMTPEQRRQARQGMDRWADMKPDERQHMRALYDASKRMPPQEREALRKKLEAMTPDQRREWLRQQREQHRQQKSDRAP